MIVCATRWHLRRQRLHQKGRIMSEVRVRVDWARYPQRERYRWPAVRQRKWRSAPEALAFTNIGLTTATKIKMIMVRPKTYAVHYPTQYHKWYTHYLRNPPAAKWPNCKHSWRNKKCDHHKTTRPRTITPMGQPYYDYCVVSVVPLFVTMTTIFRHSTTIMTKTKWYGSNSLVHSWTTWATCFAMEWFHCNTVFIYLYGICES